MAELNPLLLLEGATPRLIDEWQLAPSLWDAVRYEVDSTCFCCTAGMSKNVIGNRLSARAHDCPFFQVITDRAHAYQ